MTEYILAPTSSIVHNNKVRAVFENAASEDETVVLFGTDIEDIMAQLHKHIGKDIVQIERITLRLSRDNPIYARELQRSAKPSQ